MKKNYYQILGLDKGATLDEIKAAYRKYAAKFHPDKHGDDEFFKERFQEINEAYNYLLEHYKENIGNEGKDEEGKYILTSDDIFLFYCSPEEIQLGDIVVIEWDVNPICDCVLEIDNGYSKMTNTIPHLGIKKIKINMINNILNIGIICSNKYSRIEKVICVKKKKCDDFQEEKNDTSLNRIDEWDKYKLKIFSDSIEYREARESYMTHIFTAICVIFMAICYFIYLDNFMGLNEDLSAFWLYNDIIIGIFGIPIVFIMMLLFDIFTSPVSKVRNKLYGDFIITTNEQFYEKLHIRNIQLDKYIKKKKQLQCNTFYILASVVCFLIGIGIILLIWGICITFALMGSVKISCAILTSMMIL